MDTISTIIASGIQFMVETVATLSGPELACGLFVGFVGYAWYRVNVVHPRQFRM